FEQLRLARAQQFRQRDGRLDIGQRIVRARLTQVIRDGEVLEPEARRAVVAHRPFEALRPQGVAHAHEVDQVPARALVVPLARVGIEEVAIQQLPRDFVVETDRVVTDRAGTGQSELLVHRGGESGFDQSVAFGVLRNQAGDQAGLWLRQAIVRRLAGDDNGLADGFQFRRGAHARELHRTIEPRVRAPSFIVVPEAGLRHRPERTVVCRHRQTRAACGLHSGQGGNMAGIADDNLVWIDLEMTGLCPDRDSILEIACVVTDRELNVLATGPEFAIRHDEARLAAMDDWNRNQHRKSGLWQRVLESDIDHACAEAETVAFLAQWVPAG